MPDYPRLSQEFLYATRTGKAYDAFKHLLREVKAAELRSQLSNDTFRKSFWINLYNAFVQTGLQEHPEWYRQRLLFYRKKFIEVAGYAISLDDIEHGVLRRSRISWGLGYLINPLPTAFERSFRVDAVDYRIHFALNCGAASCPPIAFYEPDRLEQQLNLATQSYLEGECRFDSATNTVAVPKLMQWFRGDFGSKAALRQLLATNGIIPANTEPDLVYTDYNWELNLNNFIREESETD
jgi:hypothetical protein